VMGLLKFCKTLSSCSLDAMQCFHAQNDAGLGVQFGTKCKMIK
jgi:hypothetical protein